jgi:hypothetical protein
VRGLDIDLYTEIVNWEEMRDLQRAFFKANVPNQDIVQDHVIFAALYNYAAKNGINYVLTGSNYSTECVREPLEWVYLNDMRQIRDIHRRFGTMPLKTLPLCGMFKYRLYYTYIKGMKVVKPLDLIPYTKEEAMLTLEKRFGWQRYANKHFESVFTRFYEGYWLVKKFGFDKRRVHFSSLILTGQLTRDEALERLKHPPYDERIALEDMDYVAKKIGMTKEAFQLLMAEPNKSYKDYKSSAWLSMTAIKIARMLGMEGKQYR